MYLHRTWNVCYIGGLSSHWLKLNRYEITNKTFDFFWMSNQLRCRAPCGGLVPWRCSDDVLLLEHPPGFVCTGAWMLPSRLSCAHPILTFCVQHWQDCFLLGTTNRMLRFIDQFLWNCFQWVSVKRLYEESGFFFNFNSFDQMSDFSGQSSNNQNFSSNCGKFCLIMKNLSINRNIIYYILCSSSADFRKRYSVGDSFIFDGCGCGWYGAHHFQE